MFEAEEFEVLDECMEEDEPTPVTEPAEASKMESVDKEKSGTEDVTESVNGNEVKDTSEENSDVIEITKEEDDTCKIEDVKKAPECSEIPRVKDLREQGCQKQQQIHSQKVIDFTDDISIEQLNATGEYMTDEEIMNHLDEIENIVLDGTGFELQDEADPSNSILNKSDSNSEKNKSDIKPAEDVNSTTGGEKNAKQTPAVSNKDEETSATQKSKTDWYEKKLETKVATVKDRLSKLARVLEFSYPRYKGWLDRNEATTGSPICRLTEPRRCPLEKPHTNRWKFICNRKPVQESTEKQNTNKEESSGNSDSTIWQLTPTGVWDSNTDNSSEYPPFVMKAVKVFEDFLQTSSMNEPSSQSASEVTAGSNELPKSEDAARNDTDDKESGKQQWLWLLVRCNRVDELMLFATGKNIDRETMDALKQVYEVGPGKDCKVKSLYCKSVTKAGSTTNATTTFLVGSEALDEIVGGIKIQLAPKTNFWSNAAGAESLGNAVADLLAPTPKTTVVEIGCGTGLIGLMLASKCHQVIGLDSPSEVEEAEMTSELNGVKNASFVMGEPTEVMATIAKVLSNCKAVAIVNTNTNIGRAIEVMTDLRKIISLKRLVMVTTLTKQSVRSILELTRPGDHILGNPFIPIRACVVDTLPVGPHFEVVILMERRAINKFPRYWVNTANATTFPQQKSFVGKVGNVQAHNVSPKKNKFALTRVPKVGEVPVKKNINRVEPNPKKGKFIPGLPKQTPFLAAKQAKTLPPPPPKNKFKIKRVHSPERPQIPPKKFAGRYDKANLKPWGPGTPHHDKRMVNKFPDTHPRNLPYRNRSPITITDDLERQKPHDWGDEHVVHPHGSPGREKRYRDHKDQSDLRERLSGNRIEPEIMEKVKKQQQMLDMAKQKLSGLPANVDVPTAKQLQNMLTMVLEQTNKLQSQLPRSVWDRIAPPENQPSSSNVQSQNDAVLKGRYVQEMGTQDILITTPNRQFMKPNEPSPRAAFERFNPIPLPRNALVASSSRQGSNAEHFGNTAPDRYHVDYRKQQHQENQWNREKQGDKNRWEPFPQLKKNSPIRKPMSPMRHHVPPMGRPISPRRGGSPSRRPLSPHRRPISPHRRHMSPPRRQMSPIRRQISPPRRQMSPARRQMSPPRRQISPRHQISPPRRQISPPRRAMSPSRRHLSPSRRQLSPPRRIDDEWDIPSRGAIEQNTWQRPNEHPPDKRWHEDRQPPAASNWEHSAGNERYRKPVNQDKWDIKDASHDAMWNNSGSGATWEPKQSSAAPNKDHWQAVPENRWQSSSGSSNADNWNIRGKESFPKPSAREESKPVWSDGGKPRWGDSIGPNKDSWSQAEKEDWNDLPDDAKDPWGDDGNTLPKDRWPKYDNNSGPSSGWSRENQSGDSWVKPGDNWQNKSVPGNKPQWQQSGSGQMNNDSRWPSNDGPKKGPMPGGWQGNSGAGNNWSSQNYSGFQQPRSYNSGGSFKDRR